MFSEVTNNADLFSQNLPEMKTLRLLYNNAKLLFKLPENRLIIYTEEGGRTYQIKILSPDIKKYELGVIEYDPLSKMLSVSTSDFEIAWKGRKLVNKGYSKFLDLIGFETLFSKLIQSI